MKETLEIELKTKEATENAKKLSRELDRLEKDGKQAAKSTNRLSAATKRGSVAMASYVGTFIGAAGLYSAMSGTLRATIKQESAMASIESRLKSTGGVVDRTAEQIFGLASSLQDLTTYGDEDILGMQEVLLTFTNVTAETFDKASMSILDVATVMKTDLKSASLQVGKALNDPVLGMTALSRSGIQFTDVQKDLVKSMVESGDTIGAQNIILKELEKQFGGAAIAARDTLGGSIDALRNTIGDLLEGEGSTDELKRSIQDLEKMMGSAEMKGAFASMTSGILDIINAAANGIIVFTTFGKVLGEAFAERATKWRIAEIIDQVDELNSSWLELMRTQRQYEPGSAEYTATQSEIDSLENEIASLTSIKDALRKGVATGDFSSVWAGLDFGLGAEAEKSGKNAGGRFKSGLAAGVGEGKTVSEIISEQLSGVDLSGLDVIAEQYKLLSSVIDSQDPNFAIVNKIQELYALANAFPEHADIITEEIFDLQESMDGAAETSKSMSSSFEDAIADKIVDGIRSMSDALVDFAITGEQSFSDMAKSILADLAKMIIQQQIFNALAGTSLGSALGLPAVSSPLQSGSVSAAKSTALVPSAPIRSATVSGASAGVTVNVINNSTGTTVEEREESSPGGGKSIEVLIADAVDSNILSGRHNRSMGVAFGLRRIPT